MSVSATPQLVFLVPLVHSEGLPLTGAGTAVVGVDDVTRGTETFSSEWRLVALVLTV